ncbi:hypothetical protein ACTFIU_008481 [Dictyostelium citrinum]
MDDNDSNTYEYINSDYFTQYYNYIQLHRSLVFECDTVEKVQKIILEKKFNPSTLTIDIKNEYNLSNDPADIFKYLKKIKYLAQAGDWAPYLKEEFSDIQFVQTRSKDKVTCIPIKKEDAIIILEKAHLKLCPQATHQKVVPFFVNRGVSWKGFTKDIKNKRMRCKKCVEYMEYKLGKRSNELISLKRKLEDLENQKNSEKESK